MIVAIMLSLMSLTLFSCAKKSFEDELPPITTSGANTFGCKVNGKVILPYCTYAGVKKLVADFDYYPNTKKRILHVYATNYLYGTEIVINAYGIQSTGNFNFKNSINTSMFCDVDSLGTYTAVDSTSHLVITRLDTIQKIISGVFSFTGYKDSSRKKLIITDGRFDLHYPLSE
jgi:hypothetical protein